jgi:hypothetical protein
VEVPMKDVNFAIDRKASTYAAQLSVIGLVKDTAGEVVKKLSTHSPVHGPTEKLAAVREANYIYKEAFTLAPGRYTVETAVHDEESGAVSARKAVFVMPAQPQGVALSNLTLVRRFEPKVEGIPEEDTFQFRGGRITPTLSTTVRGGAGSRIALFFIVYPDLTVDEKPRVTVEYLQDNIVIGRGEVDLSAPDASGRIPYVMSSPADSMKPGMYEVRAVAQQGNRAVEERTFVTIE